MTRIRSAATTLLGLVIFSAMPPFARQAASEHESAPIPGSKVEAFVKGPKRRGSAVSERPFWGTNIVYLYCNGCLDSCYGNNAGAPNLTLTYNDSGSRGFERAQVHHPLGGGTLRRAQCPTLEGFHGFGW